VATKNTTKGSEEPAGGDAVGAPPGVGARIWEQFGTLVLAVGIALCIRAFVVEPFRIPSGSMLPTLLIGDHLFVNKFIYGPKVPFTDIRLPGLREPERGDVVVFTVARSSSGIYPADRQPELPHDDFVKRIVGLPGDRVEVRGGRVYVNDEQVELVQTDATFVDDSGRSLLLQRELLDGCDHEVLDDPNSMGLRGAAFTVEPDRYFMMGDNRDHSNDSRKWGTVRLAEIQGPAFILYWSWDVNGNFLQFLNPLNWWNAEKRWGRVFSLVRCLEEGEGTASAGASTGASGAPDQASLARVHRGRD
jgi:signal peptidase I